MTGENNMVRPPWAKQHRYGRCQGWSSLGGVDRKAQRENVKKVELNAIGVRIGL